MSKSRERQDFGDSDYLLRHVALQFLPYHKYLCSTRSLSTDFTCNVTQTRSQFYDLISTTSSAAAIRCTRNRVFVPRLRSLSRTLLRVRHVQCLSKTKMTEKLSRGFIVKTNVVANTYYFYDFIAILKNSYERLRTNAEMFGKSEKKINKKFDQPNNSWRRCIFLNSESSWNKHSNVRYLDESKNMGLFFPGHLLFL